MAARNAAERNEGRTPRSSLGAQVDRLESLVGLVGFECGTIVEGIFERIYCREAGEESGSSFGARNGLSVDNLGIGVTTEMFLFDEKKKLVLEVVKRPEVADRITSVIDGDQYWIRGGRRVDFRVVLKEIKGGWRVDDVLFWVESPMDYDDGHPNGWWLSLVGKDQRLSADVIAAAADYLEVFQNPPIGSTISSIKKLK